MRLSVLAPFVALFLPHCGFSDAVHGVTAESTTFHSIFPSFIVFHGLVLMRNHD